MSLQYPDWVNPWSAAEGKRVYRGSIALSRMNRLVAELESSEGEARFEAEFTLDSDRRPVIRMQVNAELPLQCQASLEIYRHPVLRESILGVVREEAETESLPSDYDPVLSDHGRLALQDLVEDELILGLPQVPRRPDLKPVSYRTGGEAEPEKPRGDRQKPFAGLGELLKQHAGNNESD